MDKECAIVVMGVEIDPERIEHPILKAILEQRHPGMTAFAFHKDYREGYYDKWGRWSKDWDRYSQHDQYNRYGQHYR